MHAHALTTTPAACRFGLFAEAKPALLMEILPARYVCRRYPPSRGLGTPTNAEDLAPMHPDTGPDWWCGEWAAKDAPDAT